MITSVSRDYTGRNSDLSIFPGLESPSTPVFMGISRAPKVIAGPSKCAQGFIVALLSKEGEFEDRPNDGTRFLEKIRKAQYPSDIEQAFLIESSKAIEQWNDNSAHRPLDEQIERVELSSLSFIFGNTDMSVDLTTKGGDSVTFLLPSNWSN